MDSAEQLAERYLKARFANVVHEPDGNVPPDFLLDGRIAVEVRRLNQNESSTGHSRGLEESSIPLFMKVRALLATLQVSGQESGLFVSFSYRRPLLPWSEISPWIIRNLGAVSQVAFTGPIEFTLGTFCLKIRALAENHPGRFVLTGYIDHDSGGWVLGEMKTNIELCIAEKTAKIERARAKYPEWWLILVDHIGLGLNDFDCQLFKDNVHIAHSWHKVLLLDPHGHGRAMQI